MNEHFVNVKVDREERPDVDAIYMEAVQAISGQGGWPMTVFLDPDGVPFYGGTYFPPGRGPRHAELPDGDGSGRRQPSSANARRSASGRRDRARPPRRDRRDRAGRRAAPEAASCSSEAVERLLAAADRERGGFGGAPKFPPASALELLLRPAGGRRARWSSAPSTR